MQDLGGNPLTELPDGAVVRYNGTVWQRLTEVRLGLVTSGDIEDGAVTRPKLSTDLITTLGNIGGAAARSAFQSRFLTAVESLGIRLLLTADATDRSKLIDNADATNVVEGATLVAGMASILTIDGYDDVFILNDRFLALGNSVPGFSWQEANTVELPLLTNGVAANIGNVILAKSQTNQLLIRFPGISPNTTVNMSVRTITGVSLSELADNEARIGALEAFEALLRVSTEIANSPASVSPGARNTFINTGLAIPSGSPDGVLRISVQAPRIDPGVITISVADFLAKTAIDPADLLVGSYTAANYQEFSNAGGVSNDNNRYYIARVGNAIYFATDTTDGYTISINDNDIDVTQFVKLADTAGNVRLSFRNGEIQGHYNEQPAAVDHLDTVVDETFTPITRSNDREITGQTWAFSSGTYTLQRIHRDGDSGDLSLTLGIVAADDAAEDFFNQAIADLNDYRLDLINKDGETQTFLFKSNYLTSYNPAGAASQLEFSFHGANASTFQTSAANDNRVQIWRPITAVNLVPTPSATDVGKLLTPKTPTELEWRDNNAPNPSVADDNKVLTASVSGNTVSTSWENPQGQGGIPLVPAQGWVMLVSQGYRKTLSINNRDIPIAAEQIKFPPAMNYHMGAGVDLSLIHI